MSAPASRPATNPPAPAERASVLIVEDNPVNQKLAQRLLQLRGHVTRIAGDGREGLAAWRAEPFDLVLMDISMPVMSGLEAVTHLRAEEASSGKHTPVIAVTAHAMKGDKEQCLAAGMDAYVAKPIKPAELFATIAQVIPENERQSAPSPRT